MDQKQIVKQMIDFNKTSFDNTYEAMVLIQEQAEKTADMIVEQASWLPKEGKTVIGDWVDSCKKGRNDFKKIVDENFKKVEEMIKTP